MSKWPIAAQRLIKVGQFLSSKIETFLLWQMKSAN